EEERKIKAALKKIKAAKTVAIVAPAGARWEKQRGSKGSLIPVEDVTAILCLPDGDLHLISDLNLKPPNKMVEIAIANL
nr:hypothetical protein [Tanacetum cinerariifolium]